MSVVLNVYILLMYIYFLFIFQQVANAIFIIIIEFFFLSQFIF